MNVALVAPRFPPAFDGVGDHAERIAAALERAGHDVIVFTDGLLGRRNDRYAIHEIGDQWTVRTACAVLEQIRRRKCERLLIEYTPFVYGARSGAPVALTLGAKTDGIPVGIFAHEAFHARTSSAVRDALRHRLFGWRDRVVLALADAVYVASDARAQRLRARAPELAAKTVVLPIGANVEPRGTVCAPVRARRRTIVAFGVVMPRRRLELIVDALALVRGCGYDVELEIVGRICDRVYAADCLQRAARHGIAQYVHFFDALPAAVASERLGGASIAVHAAEEGAIASSGTLLAAFAHGVPVAAVRTNDDDPRFTDLVAFAQAGAGSLATVLRRMLDDGTYAQGLAERARRFYRMHFDWDVIAAGALAHLDGVRGLSYAIRA